MLKSLKCLPVMTSTENNVDYDFLYKLEKNSFLRHHAESYELNLTSSSKLKILSVFLECRSVLNTPHVSFCFIVFSNYLKMVGLSFELIEHC